jgi:hypothetical protein
MAMSKHLSAPSRKPASQRAVSRREEVAHREEAERRRMKPRKFFQRPGPDRHAGLLPCPTPPGSGPIVILGGACNFYAGRGKKVLQDTATNPDMNP